MKAAPDDHGDTLADAHAPDLPRMWQAHGDFHRARRLKGHLKRQKSIERMGKSMENDGKTRCLHGFKMFQEDFKALGGSFVESKRS